MPVSVVMLWRFFQPAHARPRAGDGDLLCVHVPFNGSGLYEVAAVKRWTAVSTNGVRGPSLSHLGSVCAAVRGHSSSNLVCLC